MYTINSYSGDPEDIVVPEWRLRRRIIVAWQRWLMRITDGGSRHGSPSTCIGIVFDVSRHASRHWVSRTPPWAPICNPAWTPLSSSPMKSHIIWRNKNNNARLMTIFQENWLNRYHDVSGFYLFRVLQNLVVILDHALSLCFGILCRVSSSVSFW